MTKISLPPFAVIVNSCEECTYKDTDNCIPCPIDRGCWNFRAIDTDNQSKHIEGEKSMTKLKTCKCRSCGANIAWITTLSGKRMPCDAFERAYYASEDGKDTVVLPTGETVRCILPKSDSIEMMSGANGMGYVPHWATCPHAKEWKGGKR